MCHMGGAQAFWSFNAGNFTQFSWVANNKSKSYIPKQWCISITNPQFANFTIKWQWLISRSASRCANASRLLSTPFPVWQSCWSSSLTWTWIWTKWCSFDTRLTNKPIRVGGCWRVVKAGYDPTGSRRSEGKIVHKRWRATVATNWNFQCHGCPSRRTRLSRHRSPSLSGPFHLPLMNWNWVLQASWIHAQPVFRVRVMAFSCKDGLWNSTNGCGLHIMTHPNIFNYTV